MEDKLKLIGSKDDSRKLRASLFEGLQQCHAIMKDCTLAIRDYGMSKVADNER